MHRKRMDHQQRGISHANPRTEQDMSNSPTSGSARQLARKQGLARMSAVTLGVGAAGVLGAVAIAATLPQPVAAKAASAAASLTSPRPSAIANRSSDDGDDGSKATSSGAASTGAASSGAASTGAASASAVSSTSQLQASQAPSTTKIPPVATSAAS